MTSLRYRLSPLRLFEKLDNGAHREALNSYQVARATPESGVMPVCHTLERSPRTGCRIFDEFARKRPIQTAVQSTTSGCREYRLGGRQTGRRDSRMRANTGTSLSQIWSVRFAGWPIFTGLVGVGYACVSPSQRTHFWWRITMRTRTNCEY